MFKIRNEKAKVKVCLQAKAKAKAKVKIQHDCYKSSVLWAFFERSSLQCFVSSFFSSRAQIKSSNQIPNRDHRREEVSAQGVLRGSAGERQADQACEDEVP